MLKSTDTLQFLAFRSLFERRMENERMTAELAFATSIADTCDDIFESAIAQRPDLVNEWLANFESKKREGRRTRQCKISRV